MATDDSGYTVEITEAATRVSGQNVESDKIMEVALSYKKLLDELGSIEAVAQKTGRLEETIRCWLALAKLAVFLREL